jgi:hypothetical protein
LFDGRSVRLRVAEIEHAGCALRERLRDELGAAPTPELGALHELLLRR